MSIPTRRVEIVGYARIPTNIWSDADFTSLSPCAQLAYFYARTTKGTKRITDAMWSDLGINAEAVDEVRRSKYGRVIDGRARRDISAPVRRFVMERDKVCQSCGTVDALTLDHVLPYSLGGPDTVENLRVLCRPCNSRKGATAG